MSRQQLLWLLTRGVIAACVGLWMVSIYTFFVRPAIFSTNALYDINYPGMTGTAGFARSMSYQGDCAPFVWHLKNVDKVLVNEVQTDVEGSQQFCYGTALPVVKLTVWVRGVENIYRYFAPIIWDSRIPMIAVGIVVLLFGTLLIGLTLRAPILTAWAARGFARVRRINTGTLSSLAVGWILAAVFVHWLIRGSPGLVAIAGEMDNVRLLLRSIFGGPF